MYDMINTCMYCCFEQQQVNACACDFLHTSAVIVALRAFSESSSGAPQLLKFGVSIYTKCKFQLMCASHQKKHAVHVDALTVSLLALCLPTITKSA